MDTDPEILKSAAAEAAKVVPEVYEDLAKPAASETGKLLGRIPRAINAALAPLDQWIAKKEYNLERTKKLLELELEKVDPAKIVPPEPYVAVPAIQALSYSMDSETLRSLYAKLLAKAMNIETKDTVHPCFVEIVKQMSPTDAFVMQQIGFARVKPYITISIELPQGKGTLDAVQYVTWIRQHSIQLVSASLSFLEKSGLIDLHTGNHYTNDFVYDQVRNNPLYKRAVDEILAQNKKPNFENGLIKITDLGQMFYDVCIRSSETVQIIRID